jgi:photosystem I P700 chlorophyll a apoprotein A1
MYFHGARFSNYEAWLSDPVHMKPSAQIVWPIVGQEILNGDVGGGFQGIQITSGFFQLWRASGITSELQLYSTAIGGLVLAGRCSLRVGFTTIKLLQNWNGFKTWNRC